MFESLLGAIALMFAGYIIGSVRIVEEGDEALVQRLGEYKRTLRPGLNFVVPVVDSVLVETVREQLLDIEPQKAITKDSVPVTVDAIVYWKIVDLYRAYYKVDDLEESLKELVLSSLRAEIGKFELQQAIASTRGISDALRRDIEEKLRESDEEVARQRLQHEQIYPDAETRPPFKPLNTWGIELMRVEVQDISISDEMRQSLEKQRAARAQGEATLEITRATVESIRQLSEALENSDNPQAVLQYLIAQDFVKANAEIGKSENSKILFMNPGALNEALSDLLVHPMPKDGHHPGNGAA
ncbi:MAG: hypothetical protein B0A82_01060 [Alkalinema sp. CACIAM 70d]|nr:MAG: hypothetical protein B0A82_01060 [Alkalinema sp. CACIAM 70d]